MSPRFKQRDPEPHSLALDTSVSRTKTTEKTVVSMGCSHKLAEKLTHLVQEISDSLEKITSARKAAKRYFLGGIASGIGIGIGVGIATDIALIPGVALATLSAGLIGLCIFKSIRKEQEAKDAANPLQNRVESAKSIISEAISADIPQPPVLLPLRQANALLDRLHFYIDARTQLCVGFYYEKDLTDALHLIQNYLAEDSAVHAVFH